MGKNVALYSVTIPKKEANLLAARWAKISSHSALPQLIKQSLRKLKGQRTNFSRDRMNLASLTDIDFSEFEFENALKQGKSTVPGIDRITYDIFALLTNV